MTRKSQRLSYALAFISLLALSAAGEAQRGQGGGHGGAGAHASANKGAHASANRGGQANANRGAHANANRGANANGNANVNRNTNVNRNANVNRNVNRNTNVNVNRNVNVNWNRAPVRAGVYAWPRGYAYGRRPVGYIMPRPFLTATYFYAGWAALGLAAPHAGYQWVRYGSDLLLVEIGTGRVADVRYGVFAG
jgi:Ni/Co efflux regulator RcnB